MISNEMLNKNFTKAGTLIYDTMEHFPCTLELPLKLVVTWKQMGDYNQALTRLGTIIHDYAQYQSEEAKELFPFILYYFNTLTQLTQDSLTVPSENLFSFSQVITDYYMSLPYHSVSADLKGLLMWVVSDKFYEHCIYLYPEIHDSARISFEERMVGFDYKKQLRFLIVNNNDRLYYPNELGNFDSSIVLMMLEQHENSPHRYTTSEFCVSEGDVIMDIGAAEANFTLDNIEKCSKAYIVEPSVLWNPALESTFEPWKSKISLINQFVSDQTDENTTTIDEITGGNPVDFIKIDIEGFELKALQGAEKTMKNSTNLKISICTYHKADDAQELRDFLEARGFETEFSNGHMLFLLDPVQKPPYFRKGVLRAKFPSK